MAPFVERWTPKMLLEHSVPAGIAAAVILGIEEIAVTAILGGPAERPFRLAASLAFGSQSLGPSFPVWLAIIAGMAIHLALSILFAWIFLLIVAFFYQLSARRPLLLLYGVLYGLALWEINILTTLRFLFPEVVPDFSLANQILNGIIAYALFYGLVLGFYVATVRPGVVADWKQPLRL